ncbi:hypothetical protein MPER_02669, partial [Moniliophthora perniciosa FA553]
PKTALPEVNKQPITSGTPTAAPSHSKRQSKANRKRKRAENKQSPEEYKPPPGTKKRHIEPSLARVKVVDVDLSQIRVAENGFTGYHADSNLHEVGEFTLEQMVGLDSLFHFDYVEWDGSYDLPVVDTKDEVLVV